MTNFFNLTSTNITPIFSETAESYFPEFSGHIIWINILVLLFGYLMGSLNFSLIFSKLWKKEDIRDKGSKNAGATNTLRVYGKKVALAVFALDALKSFFAVLFVWIFASQMFLTTLNIHYANIFPTLAGVGAIFGHMFPVFFKFRGGKGVSSFFGLLLATNVLLFLIAVLLFIIIVIFTKYVSVASMAAPMIAAFLAFIPFMTQAPLGTLNFTGNLWWWTQLFWLPPIFLILTQLTIIFAHHSNIQRLVNKTENALNLSKLKAKRKDRK
ncbi:glycerol-3-phosphate 1-O-acyltransferase PlsY [Candidatus Mycoplasma pogonae]